MARWNSANVLQLSGEQKRVWQFAIRGDNPSLSREEIKLPSESLPSKIVSKDWQTLYKPKLNLAWLPAEKVFLRVLQLPPADNIEETTSMIDLQMEKISPLPTAQIVWTFEVLPQQPNRPQTVLVVIAPRNLVEDFLGKLENESYLADRLEIPFIDQLLSTKVEADGVWVYPGRGADENTCLITWWYGGVLQNISLLHLPPAEERGVFIREQLAQMAWAGELEGWLTSPPRRFLVADGEAAAAWQLMLQEGSEQPIEVIAPLPSAEIAKMTARRATREKAPFGLVPPEFTSRYKQQFVDRIWMRSLFAVAMLYLLGVFVYLALLQFKGSQIANLERDVRGMSPNYTNALRLRDQVRVLQDQLNLQYAALDSYKAVAEKIPEGVQLDGLNFNRGKTLTIFGTVPVDSIGKLNEFSEALRAAKLTNGEPLFKSVTVPPWVKRGNDATWNLTMELTKGEGD